MLPIHCASFGLRNRLGGLLVLLVLGGAFLNLGEAGPLKGPGKDQFREMIDSKNDPTPTRKNAAAELTAYRGKVRRAVEELPSLGEVAQVLLLSEWNMIDYGTESPELVKQAGEALREDEDGFQRAIQKLQAMTADAADVNRAVVAEIKREAREDLLKRLETRARFYLHQGRIDDRIAVANLLSDTMIESRRQDRHESITSLGMLKEPTRRGARSSRRLRQSLAALAGDLRQLIANSNPQAQAAAIRALSDLDIPASELVAAVKPKLTSRETSVVTRRAAAGALGHALDRVLDALTNLLEESRPQPRLKIVEQILPAAVLGLSDEDFAVRRSSIIACERAARILDELTRNQQMPPERRVVFRSTLQVVTDAMPQINAAARDPIPAMRVAACRVLETLALSSLRLRGGYGPPRPALMPEPNPPSPEPPSEENQNNKGVSLPSTRQGRRAKSTRPSQWATTRGGQPRALPLPPRPLPEIATPAVTLEPPRKLPAARVLSSASRALSPTKHSELRTPNSELVRPASFLAQKMDDLPAPTPIPGFWNRTVQTMIKNLSDPDYRVRLGAVDVLETLGERAEAAIPALVKALRDSNKFVRWGSARTLGRLAPRRSEEVVPGLVGLLNDREDIGVRQSVLHALEEYGEHASQAVPHLAHIINRGDKDYILAVLRTIRAIGTDAAAALPSVAWLLSDRKQPASIRIDAANTLGRFGELGRDQPRVLSVLRDVMLNDPNEAVRDAASAAVLAIDRPLK